MTCEEGDFPYDEIDHDYFELCQNAPAAKIVICANCPACGREHGGVDENHAPRCPYRPLGELTYEDGEGLA